LGPSSGQQNGLLFNCASNDSFRADSIGYFANHWTIFAMYLQVVGGPFGTVPELLFEKKQFIPYLQQMLIFKR